MISYGKKSEEQDKKENVSLGRTDGILLILALLCTAYFALIVGYSGIGTSFAFIWLFFAALLVFLVYGRWYYRSNSDKIPKWVPVFVTTTVIAGVTALGLITVMVFWGAASPARENLDYVIVLGARVKEHTVSNSLKKRLDRAILYAEENPDTVFILSGGKGNDEEASEARVMYEYLVYNGVDPEKLLLEERSVSTVENIAYSKAVMDNDAHKGHRQMAELTDKTGRGKVLQVPDKPLEVGVLTSNFHVFRARKTAEKRGIENVYGIAAQSDPVLFIHLCVRECASIIKDRLMGNM